MRESIKRQIIKLIRKVDPSISVNFHDGNMESESINSKIFVNVDEFLHIYDDEKDQLQVMKENGYIIDIMLPTYILLHEIGHIQRYRTYKNKKRLGMMYEKNMKYIVDNYEGVDRLRRYKALKLERDADKFAYKYYLHNYDMIKSFDDKIKTILTA